jgi:hypothetical protein
MVDKSKIVMLTTDTKINNSLLDLLLKRKKMNTSDDESTGIVTLIN